MHYFQLEPVCDHHHINKFDPNRSSSFGGKDENRINVISKAHMDLDAGGLKQINSFLAKEKSGRG